MNSAINWRNLTYKTSKIASKRPENDLASFIKQLKSCWDLSKAVKLRESETEKGKKLAKISRKLPKKTLQKICRNSQQKMTQKLPRAKVRNFPKPAKSIQTKSNFCYFLLN